MMFPEAPGVYKMYDVNDTIIYIGKAKNLKVRLSSYFSQNASNKTKHMISYVSKIVTIITNSEGEALLLESKLIREEQPKFNVLLKNKSIGYFVKETEHFFPKFTRSTKGFGPFVSQHDMNSTLDTLHYLFGIRNCSERSFNLRKTPCLQYHIKKCSAPCVGYISQEEYIDDFNLATRFLKGEDIKNELRVKMLKYSQKMEYEKSAKIRDHLNSKYRNFEIFILVFDDLEINIHFESITGGIKNFIIKKPDIFEPTEVLGSVIGQFYQNRIPATQIFVNYDIDEDICIMLNSLHKTNTEIINNTSTLQKVIIDADNVLKIRRNQKRLFEDGIRDSMKIFNIPNIDKIEVYDNSHIMGQYAVGAYIVVTKFGFEKKLYCKYNIAGNNDYQMLETVLRNRIQENVSMPDLIIIDGGRGHLNTAHKVLKNVPIVAMSKSEKRNAGFELFHMKGHAPFTLDNDSSLMKFLQIIRDEAHNYAIYNHRKKRSEQFKVNYNSCGVNS